MIKMYTIVAVMPSDPSKMPEVDVPGGKPKPSIEHSLIDCKLCDCSCWIGPTQLRLLRQNPDDAIALCYMCIVRLGLADIAVKMLNPDADKIPRRPT